MKEQTTTKNKEKETKPHELNDNSNLIDLMKEWSINDSHRGDFLMVDSVTFGQEMVNILVSSEVYDKVFNHLHAPLEGKIRFEDVHVLKVKIATMDHLGIRLLFVLSSSNRGRLLGFIDLMI
ncbi:hypothetical protein Tco_1118079 [Tanacetum coccineum]